MLTSMRNQKKYLNIVLWVVIFAFLATIVVVWGVGEKQNEYNYVAKVGSYTISYNEYQNQYTNYVRSQEAAGQTVEKNKLLEQTVINDIIDRQLLLAEGKRLQIPVSDAEVAAQVTSLQMFQKNDVFDVELYQQILIQNGITPFNFEEGIRRDILISKMQNLIVGTVAVTEDEIMHEYNYDYAELTSSYFTVNATQYKKSDTPDNETLAAFYETVQESYRQAPSVKLKYITFDESDFVYEANITDADVQSRYTSSIALYTAPETLELSQIIILVMDWDNESQVKAAYDKINAALAELNSGTPFGTVAKKYSEDGNAGIFGKVARPQAGQLSPLEEKIFALQPGEHTDIVRSDYGFNIYRVDSRTDTSVTPFDQVKGSLKTSMITEAKNSAYRSYLYGIYRDVIAAGNITAYLAKNPGKFEITETAFIPETDPAAFFQLDEELKRTLFGLMKTEVSPIMNLLGTNYLFEVEDRINSYIPPLEEVYAAVLNQYRNNAAFADAVADVNAKIQADNMSKEDFAKLAAQFKAKIVNIPTFKRADTTPEQWADQLINTLFSKNDGEIVIFQQAVVDQIDIIRVDQVKMPEAAAVELYKNQISSDLLMPKQIDAYEGALKDLRLKNKVVINPNYQ